MPGHNGLYVGRNRMAVGGGAYVSPYLLEILSTRGGAPAFPIATGSLTANTGQVVSCSRGSPAYCLGNDGLLHLLGGNTVRVEPSGLLREGGSTNQVYPATAFSGVPGPTSVWQLFQGATVIDNDATAPDGTATACRLTMPAGASGQDPCLYQSSAGWGAGSPATKAASIYVKMGTCRYFAMGSDATGTPGITVDLTNGSVVDASGLATYGVDTLANGWFRIKATISTVSGETVYAFGNSTNVKQVYLGPATWSDNTGGYGWIWGAQMEAYLVTSLIVTTTAPASRSGEIITVLNPLIAKGAVTNWRMRATVTQLAPFGTFNDPNGVDIMLAMGTNATPKNGRLLHDAGAGGRFYGDITDGSGATSNVGPLSPPNVAGSGPVLGEILDAAGFCSGTPSMVFVTGTNPIATIDWTGQYNQLTIGSPGNFGAPTFGFWGHYTDIVVHNA